MQLFRARRIWARLREAWLEGRLVDSFRWRWRKREAAFWRRTGLVALYRRLVLRRVTFVGVTGSCGKTTTARLTAAVLRVRFTGGVTPGNAKVSPHLERTVLRLRPWDRFCVVELAIANGRRLLFEETLAWIRPRVGVVTVVGTDHLTLLRSAEGVAAHKGKLIEQLPPDGVAVLNADDPLVRGMAAHCRGRVVTYGLAAGAELRAENVSARWPERLSFTAHHAGQSCEVRTQLCGTYLLSNVLAALATGLALGVPLEAGARAVAEVPPFPQRMDPQAHPDGFTLLRDDFKASFWSLPAVLDFLHEAHATRKVLVLGTISDFVGNSDTTYRRVARQALEAADHVVFVGNNAAKCLGARRDPDDGALHAFYSPAAAGEHLRRWLRAGDLVLIKGSPVDGLDALVAALARPPRPRPAETRAKRPRVVVGLGNPGPGRRDTPHNAGRRVLARLAERLGATWRHEPGARVARAGDVVLLEPEARMNVTGPPLRAVCERLGVAAAELVLVHDDLDLPLGAVRVRTRSGDGGHRGVRSVLHAFETDEIMRIRLGVGRPAPGQAVEDFVVTPLPPEALATLDTAVAAAAERVLELVGAPEPARAG